MKRYYTRACNFYYGNRSKELVGKKKTLPLNGLNEISFDEIEIISRKSSRRLFINNLSNLPKNQKKQILLDLKKITSKKKKFRFVKF